jgi:hypothetical protein
VNGHEEDDLEDDREGGDANLDEGWGHAARNQSSAASQLVAKRPKNKTAQAPLGGAACSEMALRRNDLEQGPHFVFKEVSELGREDSHLDGRPQRTEDGFQNAAKKRFGGH